MTLRPTLLVYGAGLNQVPVLEAARRRGFRTVAVDRDPKAPGIALAGRFVCTSLRDHEGIRAAVADETLSGVVARVTDPEALASAQRMAAGHGLPGPDESLLAAATSKRALARLCRSAGLETPRRFEVDEARAWLSERGEGQRARLASEASPRAGAASRVCVRPDVTIRGKAAIRRVESIDLLDAACEQARAASENAACDLSEWVDGIDVSALAALEHGRARRLAIFDEWVCVERDGRVAGIGAGMPSRFETGPGPIDAALAALAGACRGSRSLVTLSLRIEATGRARVIEIHLGLGGDALADRLMPSALPGFDAFDALVAFAVEARVEPPAARPLARGLLRADDPTVDGVWTLVEAKDPAALRTLARTRLPGGAECPAGLADDRNARPSALEARSSQARPPQAALPLD